MHVKNWTLKVKNKKYFLKILWLKFGIKIRRRIGLELELWWLRKCCIRMKKLTRCWVRLLISLLRKIWRRFWIICSRLRKETFWNMLKMLIRFLRINRMLYRICFRNWVFRLMSNWNCWVLLLKVILMDLILRKVWLDLAFWNKIKLFIRIRRIKIVLVMFLRDLNNWKRILKMKKLDWLNCRKKGVDKELMIFIIITSK